MTSIVLNQPSLGVQCEGPSVFKPSANSYFVMASHLTGWAPNPPVMFHATAGSLNGAVWHNTTGLPQVCCCLLIAVYCWLMLLRLAPGRSGTSLPILCGSMISLESA